MSPPFHLHEFPILRDGPRKGWANVGIHTTQYSTHFTHLHSPPFHLNEYPTYSTEIDRVKGAKMWGYTHLIHP